LEIFPKNKCISEVFLPVAHNSGINLVPELDHPAHRSILLHQDSADGNYASRLDLNETEQRCSCNDIKGDNFKTQRTECASGTQGHTKTKFARQALFTSHLGDSVIDLDD
jgi:hypothetical protein